MKPDAVAMVEEKQLKQASKCQAKRDVSFNEGESVVVDKFKDNKTHRIEAKIVRRLSPVTYLVEIAPNVIKKRHVDQILKLNKRQDVLDHDSEPEQKTSTIPRRSERLKLK